jgi:hypothetical protein
MSAGAHGNVCACSMCRRERVALDRLARQTAREAVRAAEAESAAVAALAIRHRAQSLPGATVVWGAPMRLSGRTPGEAQRSLGRCPEPGSRSGRPRVWSVAELGDNRCLYRIALDGSDVYVGMVASLRSTVGQRLCQHLRSATTSAGPLPQQKLDKMIKSRRGDEARLHLLLGQAFARRQPITVRIGRVMTSDFYGNLAGNRRKDHKLLHAFEILAGFDLLGRRPQATTAYDPSTWTFEQEDAAEDGA